MMKYRKIFLLTILCLIAVFYCADAYAAADILGETARKFTTTFKKTKGIIFIIGAFGMVGVAHYAFFGKMKWTWFAGLLTGMAVLSAAGALLYYSTKGAAITGSSGSGGDIFQFLADRAINFTIGLRNVAFCLAGFGIIMFTFLAISGKINFKHLGYIFISLFMLSGVGLFISYWTGGSAGLGALKGFARPATFTEGSAGDTYKNIGVGEIGNSSFGR